jgi:hypothetical protein
VLLVPALLYVLAFLFMPFSVIGVKSRLEVIEARLDEIQGEIRHLALRLPEMGRTTDYEEIYAPEPTDTPRRTSPLITRPPIPPASHELDDEQPREQRLRSGRREEDRDAQRPRPGGGRAEPRFDWPK